MLFNPGNQLRGSLVYGFQTGTEFFQLFALRPCGDVAKAVFGGFNAEILADGIGNAFRFHFFGIPALFPRNKNRLPIVRKLCHVFIIVELGVGNFMDGGTNGLYLAHALSQKDFLLLGGKITVHPRLHSLKRDRHGGGAVQGFQKYLVFSYIPGQGRADLRQRPSVCLGDVEHRYYFEHGNGDFLFLGNWLAVFIQQRQFGIRVQLLLLLFYLIGGGSQYLNPFFAFPDMAAKAVFPLVESGNQGGIRLLGVDQHNIVQRIAMKQAHGGQVIPVTVRFKKFLDTFFNSGGDLFDTFFVGLLVSHKMFLSLRIFEPHTG